jgi:hypothetical protein
MVEKRFTTDYAYKNRRALPSKEDGDKHVDSELRLSKIFSLSEWFKQEVWDLVYDEGMSGVSGPDKNRFEALCDSYMIPKYSVACRNKVKVCIEQSYCGAKLTGTPDQDTQRGANIQRTPPTATARRYVGCCSPST